MPYVTRIVPTQNGFEFEYMDKGCPEGKHFVCVREKGSDGEFLKIEIPNGYAVADGFSEFCDYEFYVQR